ncbi:DNA ligase [Candidatus Shapirobacteria bacterium CG10_big_fil_rev_8_21_14_0_10_38_14]|uniref:Probable DNA ligase n=1 Tax=Candidatus Shapirobacteria bacterium CG10_big_fil_rev_8_21_14_0_10_38_14 TaxID=1974483 RepID=A0A2M8L513_9BACT|nr:MAG: DNA ligase [Candidatus Shapirobacteria bacterium CG10_big_fil_rev_8_21_14_0_10_38_14]
MRFRRLAGYFAELERTASRLKITEILAELFSKTDASEIDKICYLSQGRLAALYETIEFNLAEKMMVRVLAQAYQKSEEKIRKTYRQLGDLGDTAAFFDKKEKSKPLSVKQVYERLWEIANEAGEGSVKRKINKMVQLLDDLDVQGAKYAVRIPLGKLRLGFSDLTILDALSWMISGNKSKRAKIEEAYNVRADVGQIAQIIKKKGLKGLRDVDVSLGVPLVPALCQRLANAEEMIKKMNKVAVEPKYDGTRLVIHVGREKVKIFTRNLENVTLMFPDIVEALSKEVKAKQTILDGEAIGFDQKTGKFLAFQETMQRKRKYQIGVKSKEIPLRYFVFDVLYKNGRSLLKTPFAERRKILVQILPKTNKTIILSPQIVTESVTELRRYHDEQIKAGLEGVVVKKWQAPYDPGRRGYTWVKFKSEKSKKGAGLADTLDCVVMGFNQGKGKRAGFGIGAFLVGIRQGSNFLTVSKIGTGLTDEQWREMYKKCRDASVHSEGIPQGEQIQKKPKQYVVDKNLAPDVWCQPKIVVEIQADNITKSPIHTAKYALRFPRLIRFRDDKSASQTTTLSETEKLYKLQK